MTDTTKVFTPEQIADFERRAKAGERPAYEWIVIGETMEDDGTSIPHAFTVTSMSMFSVTKSIDREGWRINGLGVRNVQLSCPLAAQLAAESLLMEATVPLHQARMDFLVNLCDKNAAALAAKEARIRELEGLNAMEVQRLISANDAANARELVVKEMATRISALESALAEARVVVEHGRDEAYKWRDHHSDNGATPKSLYWHEESSRFADALDSIDAAMAREAGQ